MTQICEPVQLLSWSEAKDILTNPVSLIKVNQGGNSAMKDFFLIIIITIVLKTPSMNTQCGEDYIFLSFHLKKSFLSFWVLASYELHNHPAGSPVNSALISISQ